MTGTTSSQTDVETSQQTKKSCSLCCTTAVRKVRELTRVITLWRCGDGIFFEVPPLASDALLTTLHLLLEDVLHTIYRKIQEDSGTGGFDRSQFVSPSPKRFHHLKTAVRLIA
jgi:hypothetical protein